MQIAGLKGNFPVKQSVYVCVCVCLFTHKAVCVFWSKAATCTLTVAAVTHIGAETTAVTLLCTHRLSYCGVTDL